MKRRVHLTVLASLMLATGFSFAADPIKVGVTGPYTGGSSSMGVSMRDGVKLAINEINKAGGVLGRQLLAVERDDEAKNERGGCGVKLGLVYAAIPRLSLYSMGLSEPRDILIRFSLYQRI